MITLKPSVWEDKIRPRLIEMYGQRTFLTSTRLKETLSFTVRYHHGDMPHYMYGNDPRDDWGVTVCLDFYDDSSETMIRMMVEALKSDAQPAE